MTVALGTYVSTTTLKDQLGGTAAMGTADDALLGVIVAQVNTYIESVIGRSITVAAAGTVTFDVPSATDHLFVPQGLQSVSSLLVADYTGATAGTVASADVFLRPLNRRPGWPYTEIWLSDVPTGSIGIFSPGYGVVQAIGTVGWAEVPEDLEGVAIRMAVRAWHARASGENDAIGVDDMGQPVVSRGLSKRDRDTLYRYTIPPVAV